MSETRLAVYEGGAIEKAKQPERVDYSLSEMVKIAELLAASKYFADAREQAQAFAKILRGSELGIGPATSLSEISIVQGKPQLSSSLMAMLVKRSGKYNYRVKVSTAEACEIEFFEFGESIGTASFTMEDAKRAGLAGKGTWSSYPADLLFARCMSRGAKRFCADVLGGVYVEGEIEERPAPMPAARVESAPQPAPKPGPTQWLPAERKCEERRCNVERIEGERWCATHRQITEQLATAALPPATVETSAAPETPAAPAPMFCHYAGCGVQLTDEEAAICSTWKTKKPHCTPCNRKLSEDGMRGLLAKLDEEGWGLTDLGLGNQHPELLALLTGTPVDHWVQIPLADLSLEKLREHAVALRERIEKAREAKAAADAADPFSEDDQ